MIKLLPAAIICLSFPITGTPAVSQTTTRQSQMPDLPKIDDDRASKLLSNVQTKKAAVLVARKVKSADLKQIEQDFSGAWTEALQFGASASDDAQSTISNAWASAWKDEGDRPVLVDALNFSHERAFLTDAIVKFFMETNDIEVIRSISHLIVDDGKPDDLSLLEKKLDATSEPKMTAILESAVSWRKYKNNPTGPGPSTLQK